MSNTYFCFSDECGCYNSQMSEKQLKTHPFYIRSTLIINSSEWKVLNFDFNKLKSEYGIPKLKELKWAHLWTLRHFQKNNKVIPKNHELKFFEKIDYHILIEFVEKCLKLINTLREKKIILTYTRNDSSPSISERVLSSMHLQELMQRVQFELKKDEQNLGILFLDPVNAVRNESYREKYHALFENGDFFTDYNCIKDSLNIENSRHSVGIQIADYIAGSFSAVLKSTNENDYSKGVRMFFKYVYPHLRRKNNGDVQGYGIREVPKNDSIREWLINQLIDTKFLMDSKSFYE